MQKWMPILCLLFLSCRSARMAQWPMRKSTLTGTDFYKQAAAMNWAERDSFVLKEVMAGNVPGFLKKFIPVSISFTDTATGKLHSATCYVLPDYLSIGTDKDWARVCITPMAAQRIADSLNCFLPTRKLVNDIYNAAKVKLEPVPMYAYRDSTPTMWQHHLIIEGQRQGKQGLIAGIKKDVVLSDVASRHPKQNRVAIYGWHKTDGKPIQPLYAGHVNWYVDYSHGIRLVYRNIKLKDKWVDYSILLLDPLFKKLLCDESFCDFTRY